MVYCAQTEVEPAGTVGTVTNRRALRVTARGLVARVNLVRKNLELLDKDGRLDGVEARGKADPHIVVFVAALPVDAQASQRVGEPIIVGHHSAAVAIASERLCGKETGRRRVTKGAEPAVVVDAAKALRGIVKDQQIFGFAAAAIAE